MGSKYAITIASNLENISFESDLTSEILLGTT